MLAISNKGFSWKNTLYITNFQSEYLFAGGGGGGGGGGGEQGLI